jgi:hypothetical protein
MIVRKEHLALGFVLWIGATAFIFFTFFFPTLDLQYAWQADAFLRGRLHLDAALVEAYSAMDTTVRDGRYYWPLGPLPAILLLPYVFTLGPGVDAQTALHLLLVGSVACLAYFFARRSGIGQKDAAWLTAAFCFGSVAIGVLGMLGPWQLAHASVLACILAALVEWRGKRRLALVGTLFGLALAARVTAVAGGAFFAIMLLAENRPWRERFRRLALFALPVLGIILALAAFNAARFGSPFDNGYGDSVMIIERLDRLRAEDGLFNLSNVPRNAWYYFAAPPSFASGRLHADPEGMSLFLLSPAFLLLLRKRTRTTEEAGASVSFLASLAVLLPFYATGFAQFGPRYLTDVLPFAYVLLVDAIRERGLGAWAKALIAASALANLLLFARYLIDY